MKTFVLRVTWQEPGKSRLSSNVFSIDAPNLPAATDEIQHMISHVVSVSHVGTIGATSVNRGAW